MADIETLAKQSEKRKAEIANLDSLGLKSLYDDELIKSYQDSLYELRKDGINKILDLKQKIAAAKKNKMLDYDVKAKMIEEYSNSILDAKKVQNENAAIDKEITKAAISYANVISKKYISEIDAIQDSEIAKIKAAYFENVQKIKSDAEKKIAEAKNDMDKETASYELKSALFDAKNRMQTEVGRCKDAKRQAFTDHVQINRNLRNGNSNIIEDTQLNFKNYVNNFKLSKFLLDNGLYLAILLFFIICIAIAPSTGAGNLLTISNIFSILEQSSTRMFYALGVAGLILLAGTDLSVGRMVAIGSVITGLILHPGVNIVKFFNMGPWDFTALPTGVRIAMALILSIVCCTFFCAFAGFFTAKLKIHPFVSTLATQLVIYGLLFFGTTGTPVGSIDADIKDLIGGRWQLTPYISFPKLIIPAIIAIIVAWFIWNKTTFGKNMYAVGGNAEAASVSGISVFWVTMGVFIMAGIFYGCGAFLEAFRANASAGTGQGFEMDAIAACVVGGISFNGGIGKIGGAAIGVIIFTSLTYCLTFLKIDTNLQFVIKGLIIIAAVALDSIKYLKRK
ncbi:MAG: galactoside ABC transporter permease [Treponema sp.]|nr:galactoside ABC transporter permease [Treponema sp.]